ncbi:MAG TPA: phosphate ABC transporter permease PstA [Vicinamibacteria bacterium]|nr:phosphate ABC transporter permease PstA [Vicinamibacteria bacterium]
MTGPGPRDAARPKTSSRRPRGDVWVWLTGSALAVCLLMITLLVAVILVNGLGFFWPRPLVKVALTDGGTFLGQVMEREPIPAPGTPAGEELHRVQLKVGNRDLLGFDFRWIDEAQITAVERPPDVVYVERREYGPLLGTPVRLADAGQVVAQGSEETWTAVQPYLEKAEEDRKALREIERDQIGAINHRIEQARLEVRKLELEAARGEVSDLAERRAELERGVAALQDQFRVRQQALQRLLETTSRSILTVAIAGGQEKEVRTLDVFRAFRPNRLTTWGRVEVYASRLWEFISGDPRESNTEGGIFPAIFGTVMMVMIMSVAAVPFGVLAALYLREYARQGALVRIVRIAVNNLAGVPSIVFGVFGLGFFVYVVGGSLDRLFYPESLPTPTFGTGGILWASLTLALLTVPVVIVASEEALAAVPRSMREASLATGATKWQTIQRVVLPAAAPGILTGLILAMARGAGEVAPLMITGVVKLAPDLPLDGYFPFLHLDRKFMHLGFHIYDVGFQSPNVEAAKPMVYMTTILLLVVVVVLNLTAIIVRNHLRRKYQTSAF